jgi:hypothetical protein
LAPEDQQPKSIGEAISEVSERAALLVREEIELAKVEMTQKLTKLVTGAAIGIAAGVFGVAGMIYFLHGAAWGLWTLIFGTSNADIWVGFFIVAGILFLLGGLAGFIAARALRGGAPPKPELAMEEARRIRETVTAHREGGAS